MVLPEDPGKLNLDSWGLKRLHSHLLRRWLAGTVSPRATSPNIVRLCEVTIPTIYPLNIAMTIT